MIDLRPIFLILGVLVSTLALVMAVPALADLLAGHPDWQVFAVSSGVTLFVGISLTLTNRSGALTLTLRQAFLLTTLAWIVLTLFASLPFMFAENELGFTDAFFEAMSGITTTGSTVMVGLDTAPPGILLWRALLQWLGGIGIIVMALAVLPNLRVGGMQLFRMESSDKTEKAMPRAAQIASGVGVVYLGFTIVCAIAFWLAGMSGFDAIAHAMTTIATAGYSTHDASIGYFDSALIDFIATVGMVAGGIPFMLYLVAIQGRPGALARDSQVQFYLTVLVVVTTVVAGWLWLGRDFHPLDALRYASFNVVSVMTTTGYATAGYDTWGPFVVPVFFFLIFAGGCAGSTAGGIKMFRFLVLYAGAATQLRKLVHPHGVFIPTYNRQPISEEVITAVLSFFFVFGTVFVVLSVALAMLGLDFLTSVSAAAQAVANVGPGLGPIVGPSGNFSTLPDAAKWLLSAGMLLGRLELFTVMVLFTRIFWRG